MAAQLLPHRGTALQLDAQPVQRIGGLGVEVLLVARKQWESDGVPFTISGWTLDAAATLQVMGAEVLQ
ncbi:chemotaxis protein CheX [Ketogulonicigenium robustum]|uniref:Chemotaxis protein CheX n=1 Tax=Ketogulonicigenium robustum TaxID=92947 RepID=A0A1W6P000_9RHOB|nr:chemotaxis protein CheX [Ketogulonicigenium robustum]